MIKFIFFYRLSTTWSNLFVHDNTRTLSFQVPGETTVAELKEYIAASTGLSSSAQRLMHGNKLLQDSEHCWQYNECNINLCCSLKGGSICDICGAENPELHCKSCDKALCSDCSTLVHRHPQRQNHVIMENTNSCTAMNTDSPDSNSQSSTVSDFLDSISHDDLEGKCQVAELADTFELTRFRDYQRLAISAALNGKDSLIIQPTGSGKSLCYQFPPVYTHTKAVVVCPTISLMQDQHALLTDQGIQCTYLGSAQVDKSLERSVFTSEDPHRIIFVTPEWLFKDVNLKAVEDAALNKTVTLIAVDEAHLICEWQSFRSNYRDLETIKNHFPSTPVMFLTATATPSMAEKLKGYLSDPTVLKGTMNRPYIILDVQEVTDKGHVSKENRGNYIGFVNSVCKIIKKDTAIIYTDFIADIVPITQALDKVGITSAHYHGELDAKSKLASYRQWANSEVQVMVATKAFGMGINSGNVRHVIRNGVPPNINTWVQELGRAGRSGQAATATILYSESDVQNVLGWLHDHLQNRLLRDTILAEYDMSWKLVYCKLAGRCLRKALLEYYNEELTDAAKSCCEVCDGENDMDYTSCTREAKLLVQAIRALGPKGECKLSEFLRGSNSSWLTEENKRTATEVQQGSGLGFVPASADLAAAHVGRVRLEMRKARSTENQVLLSIFEFETVADSIDANDNSHSGSPHTAKEYAQLGRPYMREAGISKGIKFALLQSPFMSQQLSKATFIECDITYLEHAEYKYLFNVTAFDEEAM